MAMLFRTKWPKALQGLLHQAIFLQAATKSSSANAAVCRLNQGLIFLSIVILMKVLLDVVEVLVHLPKDSNVSASHI